MNSAGRPAPLSVVRGNCGAWPAELAREVDVPVVGVTGHANLTDESIDLVRGALMEVLRPHAAGLVGMTCLARGADQAFADAVLELGGALDVGSLSRRG